MLEFEWDAAKARLNARQHGVSFEEASSVFHDPLASTEPDEAHSEPDEERLITIGRSSPGRTLYVAHVDRGKRIRLISARRATTRERERYEQDP